MTSGFFWSLGTQYKPEMREGGEWKFELVFVFFDSDEEYLP